MKTFSGNIAVKDFAPLNTGSTTVQIASPSTEETLWLQSSSPQNPTTAIRRETSRQWNRSRSAPDRRIANSRSRRRSTFEISPPPNRTRTSRFEDQTQEPANIVSQLRKNVIDLFMLILEQEESSLIRSQSPVSQRPKSGDVQALLTTDGGDHSQVTPKSNIRSQSQPRKRDFKSLEWFQQKVLLNRELRRLLSWDLNLLGSKSIDRTMHNHEDERIFNAFAIIGKSLVGLLKVDMLLEEHMNGIRRLTKDFDWKKAAADEALQCKQGESPLDNIQNAINYLFEPQPIRRKNTISDLTLKATATQLPTSLGGTSISKDDFEGPRKKAPKVEHIHGSRQVRFVLGEPHDSMSEVGLPAIDAVDRKSQESTPSVENSPVLSPKLEPCEEHLESKFVIKIADRLDAFDKGSNVQRLGTFPGPTEDLRPQIRRFTSGELPNSLSQISLLINSFSEMSLGSRSLSNTITKKLLNLARVKETFPEVENSSDASQTLRQFDKILGLIASLPSWQIYKALGHNHSAHAKSAVSVICLSLIEEVSACAVTASQALQEQLKDKEVSEMTKHDVRLFFACIQRFSALNRSVKSIFDAFQGQFDRVIAKLEDSMTAKPSASTPDDMDPNSGNTSPVSKKDATGHIFPRSVLPSEGEEDIYVHDYHPLALACYLSPPAAVTDPAESTEEEVPTGLRSVTVKDMFDQRDLDTFEEAAQEADSPECDGAMIS